MFLCTRSIKSYCTFVFDIWTFKNYTGIIDRDLFKYIYRQMRSNLKWVKKLANIGKKIIKDMQDYSVHKNSCLGKS